MRKAGLMLSRSLLRLFALLLLSLSAGRVTAADEPFILVSDVDDTVKVTDVLHRNASMRNAIRSKLVFAGMSELYRNLLGKDSPPERLEFISGSPRALLTHKVDECLRDAHFPPYRAALRNRVGSVADFKTRVLRKLYGASENQFLLIGDDTQSDPEVYAKFAAAKKPDQVLVIYIHQIKGRALPPRSIPYLTAYDIALQEYRAHRLSAVQAGEVGVAVLASQETAFLPGFQKCPQEYSQLPDLPKPLEVLQTGIRDRMKSLCSKRPR
jgi:Uncharacterized conserved protein (DUF2183)